MKLPNWISNLTHPPSWLSRAGLRLDSEPWPTMIPLKLGPGIPNLRYRELAGKIVTLEIRSPEKPPKDIVLQLSLEFGADGIESTPEVICYPCDGNCLEVFKNLPVEAVCVRPKDLDTRIAKHFGDRR